MTVAARSGKRRRAAPEYALQKALIQHIRVRQRPNVYWCAIPNSGGRATAKTGTHLKAMGLRAGAPDLFFVIKGKAIALELKTKSSRLSEAQVTTMNEWEDAGGDFFVSYSLDQALEILELIGAIK